MSKMLEVPDEVYDERTETAKAAGMSLAELIRVRVSGQLEPVRQATPGVRQAGLQRLMQLAGCINTCDRHSANNDHIDADLHREYGRADEG